ncbi:uncharacterized [Tachysurus ichikawai]
MTLTYGLARRSRVLAVRPDRDEIGWHPMAPQYASGRGGYDGEVKGHKPGTAAVLSMCVCGSPPGSQCLDFSSPPLHLPCHLVQFGLSYGISLGQAA